jgi:hypothetical protein
LADHAGLSSVKSMEPMLYKAIIYRRSMGKNLGRREAFMLGTILIIILILALIGALPTWGHSRSWGYYPSGGLGLILVIIIILVLLGRI